MRERRTMLVRVWRSAVVLGVLSAAGVAVGTGTPVSAASYVVTSLADTNDGACNVDCTLREAILAANASSDDDTITFDVDGTIALTSNLPGIAASGSLTIVGNGPDNTIVDGGGVHRSLFTIRTAGADVTVADLRATNGQSSGTAPNFGGAIDLYSEGGTLTVDGVVLDNGTAGYGGAINADYGTLTVTNSVIRNNTGTTVNGGIWIGSAVNLAVTNSLFTGNGGQGGAIFSNSGTVTIINSTIADNTSSGSYAEGVDNNGGTLTIRNSILAGNVGTNSEDCDGGGTIEFSLIGDGSCAVANGVNGNQTGDPLLDPDFAPTAVSPVVNAGDNTSITGFTTDLAGEPRIQSDIVDLGAYESPYPYEVTIEATDDIGSEAGDPVTFRITRTPVDSAPLDVDYTIGGTAGADDYTPTLAGSATIPADSAFVDIVLTPVDDDVDEGDETVVLTLSGGAGYVVGATSEATVTITDDDTAGVTVDPTSGLVTSEAGGTDTFSIVLTSEPTADVAIALSSSDTTEGTVAPASVAFTGADWDTPQVVTVTGVDDLDDDGDVAYTIVIGATASADPNYDTVDPPDVAVTNLDADTVGPTATLTDATGPEAPQVGDPIVVTITFDEEPLGFTDDDLIVGGTAGATGGTLTGGPLEWTFTIPAVSEPGTVTVSLPPGVVFDAAENPNTASEPLTVTVEAAPATTTTTTTSTTTTTTTPTTTTAPTTTVAPTAPTSSLVGELPATGSGPGSVMPYALLLLGAGILALLIASTRRRQSAGPTV